MCNTISTGLQIGAAIGGAVVASIVCPAITPMAVLAIAATSVATQTLFRGIASDIKCLSSDRKSDERTQACVQVLGGPLGCAIALLVLGLLGIASFPVTTILIACGVVAAISLGGAIIGLILKENRSIFGIEG